MADRDTEELADPAVAAGPGWPQLEATAEIHPWAPLISRRPLVGPLIVAAKRVVHRLLRWDLWPVTDPVTAHHRVVASVLDQHSREIRRLRIEADQLRRWLADDIERHLEETRGAVGVRNRVRGSVDDAGLMRVGTAIHLRLRGWAWSGAGQRCRVVVTCDGAELATFVPDGFRPDVSAALGIGPARCGFDVVAPGPLAEPASGTLTVAALAADAEPTTLARLCATALEPPRGSAAGLVQPRGRVGFVYPFHSVLDVIPQLREWWAALVERGYLVDVFTGPAEAYPPTQPGISFHPLDLLSVAGTAGARLPGEGRARLLHRTVPYDWFVGLDPVGLTAAAQLRAATGGRLAYLSVEVLPSAEITDVETAELKSAEQELSRCAELVISQDRERAELLLHDLPVSWDRVALLPNSPRGRARRRRTRACHELFDLPAATRVALYAGFIGEHAGLRSLIAGVEAWPHPWVLVVHAAPHSPAAAVAELQRSAAGPRVVVSTGALPYPDYEDLVDGADLGIALYHATGDSLVTGANVATIGLSSGKIAAYLHAGLPVVIRAQGAIVDIVESHRCGEVVDDGSEVGAAIARIAADLDGYGSRALAAFDRHLDIDGALQRLLDRMGLADPASVAVGVTKPGR